MSTDPVPGRVAFDRSSLPPPKVWETGEEDLLWLAEFNPVRYQHPGIFQAAHGYVQIERHRVADFLVRLETIMGVGQARSLETPYNRFAEYDALTRAVYLGHCEVAKRAKLFEIFRLRVVNAGEPGYADRYRYPVQRNLKGLKLS